MNNNNETAKAVAVLVKLFIGVFLIGGGLILLFKGCAQ